MEFTLIIFSLLCRLAPVQAASWIVAVVIEWAVKLLENEDHRFWIEESPQNAQWFGGWLAFAEGWLDVLICMRAHRLIKHRWPGLRLPTHRPVPAVRSLAEGYNRLVRLYDRYAEAERLARRKAVQLRRLYAGIDPLGLAPSVASRHLPRFAGEENRASLAGLFLPRLGRGRWFATPSGLM